MKEMPWGGGGQACIYNPLGSTTALGSNRLKRALKINPQSRWRQDLRGLFWLVEMEGRAPLPPRAATRPPSRFGLSFDLEPPGTFWITEKWMFALYLYVNPTCGPSLVIFSWHPAEIDIHQNSWNYVSDNPISTRCLLIDPFSCLVDG